MDRKAWRGCLGGALWALAAVAAAAAKAEVPLRLGPTGHLLVQAYVDGQGPFPFILDTGADRTAVYEGFARAHRLPAGHADRLSGATGEEGETTSRIDRLSIDGRTLRRVDADTVPDRPDGADIAGILGADMLGGRLAVIDTGCGSFRLAPRGTNAASPGAARIDAGSIHDGRQLTFPVNIDGAAGVGILDSGARSSMLNRRFARAAGIDVDGPGFTDGPPARGATQQPVPSRIGPVGVVRFGGVTRDKVTARVVDLPAFDDPALVGKPVLNLGADLMGGLRLTLDYQARRFWIAPSACPAGRP